MNFLMPKDAVDTNFRIEYLRRNTMYIDFPREDQSSESQGRRSRAGGRPGPLSLDFRLRGNVGIHFKKY